MNQLHPDVRQQPMLIVEDNRFMRGLLSELLRDMGMERISLAGDGREAIETFRDVVPSFVLTDWHMPGLSGLEFTKWVRQSADSPNSSAHIVLITSANQENEIVEARDAGITEFITKPITPQAVVKRLNASFLRPRSFVRSPAYVGPCRRRRSAALYGGTKRRLNDPLETTDGSAKRKAFEDAISAELMMLTQAVREVDVTNRRQLQHLHAAVRQLLATVRRHSDPEFETLTQSLLGYMEGMGANGRLDREVLLMHASALSRLLIIDPDDPQRAATVTGLQKVVAKRIRQAQRLAS